MNPVPLAVYVVGPMVFVAYAALIYFFWHLHPQYPVWGLFKSGWPRVWYLCCEAVSFACFWAVTLTFWEEPRMSAWFMWPYVFFLVYEGLWAPSVARRDVLCCRVCVYGAAGACVVLLFVLLLDVQTLGDGARVPLWVVLAAFVMSGHKLGNDAVLWQGSWETELAVHLRLSGGEHGGGYRQPRLAAVAEDSEEVESGSI